MQKKMRHQAMQKKYRHISILMIAMMLSIAVAIVPTCGMQVYADEANLQASSAASPEEIAEAEAAVAAAKQKVDDAQAVIDQGTLGFFKYVGSAKAVKILEDRVAVQSGDSWGKTQIGTKGDATDLENMKASFDWIRESNELRATDPHNSGVNKQPLMVADAMMAISQVQGNASANVIGHSQLHSVAENLSWGYIDPFDGWYTAEKAIWEKTKQEDGDTGHYLNIANPTDDQYMRYGVTGFACIDKSGVAYGICHEQSFMWDSNSITSGESVYTVDEYEARFDEYYDAVKTDLSSAKAEYKAAQKELETLIGVPSAVKIKSLSASKKALTVKWKKSSDADGYEIQYSTKSSFKGAKTINVKKSGTTSQKISKLKAKKKYYVRMRAYKTVNDNKYYSSWSSKKSAKTK